MEATGEPSGSRQGETRTSPPGPQDEAAAPDCSETNKAENREQQAAVRGSSPKEGAWPKTPSEDTPNRSIVDGSRVGGQRPQFVNGKTDLLDNTAAHSSPKGFNHH